MDIEMTQEEIDVLDAADNDIGMYGKTERRCPRCGNEIIIEEWESGSGYTIRCKTDGCIEGHVYGF